MKYDNDRTSMALVAKVDVKQIEGGKEQAVSRTLVEELQKKAAGLV